MKSKTLVYSKLVTESDFNNYLIHELECPLPCKEGEKFYSINEELLEVWKEICKSHEIDRESEFIRDYFEETSCLLEIEDYAEIKRACHNVNEWIDLARKEFLDKTRSVTTIMADTKIYAKHFINRPLNIQQIRKLALHSNTSYFFPIIKPSCLDKILLNSLKEFFDVIIKSSNLRYGIKCICNIGVTKSGNETKYLMIEINGSSGISHAYPCDEIEIGRLKLKKSLFEIDKNYCC